jgi:hypothetical protein
VKEPLFEPDLTTPARPRNANRLLHVVAELDMVADVAAGKLIAGDDIPSWLRPVAAPRHGEPPAELMVQWLEMFGDELETVRRARNNIEWGEYISDGNVAAAVQIAERVLHLARAAAQADSDES